MSDDVGLAACRRASSANKRLRWQIQQRPLSWCRSRCWTPRWLCWSRGVVSWCSSVSAASWRGKTGRSSLCTCTLQEHIAIITLLLLLHLLLLQFNWHLHGEPGSVNPPYVILLHLFWKRTTGDYVLLAADRQCKRTLMRSQRINPHHPQADSQPNRHCSLRASSLVLVLIQPKWLFPQQ